MAVRTRLVLQVRRIVKEKGLPEPIATHAQALMRRVLRTQGLGVSVKDPQAWAAGIEYLARRVEDFSADPDAIAARRDVQVAIMLRAVGQLRTWSGYRAYVGEWIRLGRALPSLEKLVEEGIEVEATTLQKVELETGGDNFDIGANVEGARSRLEADVTPHVGRDAEGTLGEQRLEVEPPPEISGIPDYTVVHPKRWRENFALYTWQQEATHSWDRAGRRGILRVVTGAGKTVFALYQLARLLGDAAGTGYDLFTIIVVPRVLLIDQWLDALRKHLYLEGLRIGKYHGRERCYPHRQDVLIITQDSARRLLPEMSLDRPTLLIADECHRLGAPAASRILDVNYKFTIGLSATPERTGDTGFEDILQPRIGRICFQYGYREAVRDGIISKFALLMTTVELTPAERVQYEESTQRIKSLLQSLKSDYYGLRTADDRRFFQLLGKLRRDHPDDRRFEQFTAVAAARRSIVHLAVAKFSVVESVARLLGEQRRVLCFHERIEAADQLVNLIKGAGRSVTAYHTGIPADQRATNLSLFGSGVRSWLVACRSLDEGLDIPAVDTVLIVAGAKAPRQIIQRLGRALRRMEGDNSVASIIIIQVADIDEDVIDQDELADLREAAAEVHAFDPAGLFQWIGQHVAQTGVPKPDRPLPKQPGLAKKLLTSIGRAVVRSRKPRPVSKTVPSRAPGLTERNRDVGVEDYRSWTGSTHTVSYYDKDSSPD